MRTKILLTILIITASLLVAAMPGYAASIYESSLVGYWPMDTNANDYSGNNDNGNIVGATQADGVYGNSYSYNGTDNYIYAATNSVYDFEWSDDFAISAWVKTAQTTTTYHSTIIAKTTTSDDWHGWSILPLTATTGEAFFNMYTDNNPTSNWCVKGTTAVNDGEWHNIVAVHRYNSGNSSDLHIYVDGADDHATITGDNNLDTQKTMKNTANLLIGWRGETGYSKFFEGSIDEVAIWSDDLSTQRIYELYVYGIRPDKTNHRPDLESELTALLTSKGINSLTTQLGTLVDHIVDDSEGNSWTTADGITHYEPDLTGDGSSTPFHYDFSDFADTLLAYGWDWNDTMYGTYWNGTSDVAYGTFNNWFERTPYGTLITADGDTTVEDDEYWFLKTGGGIGGIGGPIPTGGDTPEPATIVSLLGLIAMGMRSMRKSRRNT